MRSPFADFKEFAELGLKCSIVVRVVKPEERSVGRQHAPFEDAEGSQMGLQESLDSSRKWAPCRHTSQDIRSDSSGS